MKYVKKHNIKFETLEKEFIDRDDVKDWIDKNQLGRRNLTDAQRRIVIGRRYNREKAKRGGDKKSKDQVDTLINKAEQLAEDYNLSAPTIKRYSKDAELFERLENEKPELADEIWSGKKDFKDVKQSEKKAELEQKKQEYSERVLKISQNKNERKIDIFETDKKFRIIYADPPWSYNDKCETGAVQSGGVELRHYDVMSIKQLCDLPVQKITEKNAVLFMWVTSPLLEECFDIINEWGFKYKASFVWDKIRHNMGHYNSVRHEFLLICTKGSCIPDEKKLIDSVQSIEKTDKHSEKPIEFINIIDELYTHGDRIEMFCRDAKKENWFFWGNEV